MTVLDSVINQMVMNAIHTTAGGGLFFGSPRQFMEEVGVSSGSLYYKLYSLGFRRLGRGQGAVWVIPPRYMKGLA